MRWKPLRRLTVPPQGSVMLLPTKMVSDKFCQQLLGPDPNSGDSSNYIKAYKEDQKARSMSWAFPSFVIIRGNFFHKKCESQVNMSPIKALELLHWCIIPSFDKIFETPTHTPTLHTHHAHARAHTHPKSMLICLLHTQLILFLGKHLSIYL